MAVYENFTTEITSLVSFYTLLKQLAQTIYPTGEQVKPTKNSLNLTLSGRVGGEGPCTSGGGGGRLGDEAWQSVSPSLSLSTK